MPLDPAAVGATGETVEVALALSVPDIATLTALNDGHAVDAAAEA